MAQERRVSVLSRVGGAPPWVRFIFGSLLPLGALPAIFVYVRVTDEDLDARPLLLLPVLIASWFGGVRAGLLTTLLSLFVIRYTLFPPFELRWYLKQSEWVSLGVFVVSSIAVILFSAWCRRTDQRRAIAQARLVSLQQNAETLLRAVDPEAVAQQTVGECMRMLGAGRGFIAQLGPETQHPKVLGATGCGPATIEAWTRGEDTPLNDASFTQNAVFIRGSAELGLRYPFFAASLADGTRSLAAVPLRSKGRRYGVLCLSFPFPARLIQDEVALITQYADQAGDALDRCQAFAEIDRQSHEFNIISDASLAFSESEVDATPILGALVEVCARYLGDAAAAYRVSSDGQHLDCVAYRNGSSAKQASEEAWRAKRIRFGEGLGGSVAATGRPRLINGKPSEFPNGSGDEHSPGNGEEIHSAVSVPVMAGAGVVGVLTIERTGFPRFGRTHAQLAQELARRAGFALIAASERAEAEQELERRLTVEAELRENQVRLEEALAAKDEFLALVSHELRTPLTMIRGNADILRRFPGLHDESRYEALADLSESSEKLSRIVENMLLLARLESGRQPDLEPVLLYRAITRARDDFLRESPKADIRLDAIANELIVVAHEDYLSQILENLFSNAVKYSPAGERIDISVHTEGCLAVVEVADCGVGIDPETASDLFKAFHRENVQQTQISGLGLGLTVCKRLVEAQQGWIAARPRESGGSVFSFALPLWRDEGVATTL